MSQLLDLAVHGPVREVTVDGVVMRCESRVVPACEGDPGGIYVQRSRRVVQIVCCRGGCCWGWGCDCCCLRRVFDFCKTLLDVG